MTIIEQRTLEIICSSLPQLAKSLSRIAETLEKRDEKTCCICGKVFSGYGNNPWPIMNAGECCNDCNSKVIAARIVMHNKKGE